MHTFHRWAEWAAQHHKISVFSVEVMHFALYLQHLGDTTHSKSAVEEAVNAIGWVNQLADQPPIAASPFICATLSGQQRNLAKPKVRKEPIKTEMLIKLVNNLGSTPKLSEVRLVAIALLSFSAFLRYNELSQLRCCDITINEHT